MAKTVPTPACPPARLLVCPPARLLVCSSARLLVCKSARLPSPRGIAATQSGRPAMLEFITTKEKIYSTFRSGYH